MGYIAEAKRLGFDRVQFTGGEPLLHPQIAGFVTSARRIFGDVGVTTNGTHLPRRSTELFDAGISRVHVSLQAESLELANADTWRVPADLVEAADWLSNHGVVVRFNLPIAIDALDKAQEFLFATRASAWRFNLFALLPTPFAPIQGHPDYLRHLSTIAREASDGWNAGKEPRVTIRGYVSPSGVRCPSCQQRSRCTEQSRSLRLGVDEILRPCLASREWDIHPKDGSLVERMRAATLLAIDW